jgi:hypothetical protein
MSGAMRQPLPSQIQDRWPDFSVALTWAVGVVTAAYLAIAL